MIDTNTVGCEKDKGLVYITTYTGKKFYPERPSLSDIDILDIAHALSNQCRYSGHTTEFYSVAQHCYYVSCYLEQELKLPQFSLAGLLHDGSEAFIVDIPRPIKHLVSMNNYREMEELVQDEIYYQFGIDIDAEKYESIKEADNVLLATEARDLMEDASWAKGMKTWERKIDPWLPKVAEFNFLARFKKLYYGNRTN